MTKECSVDGCERARHTKDLCSAHVKRLRRNGSLGTQPVGRDQHRGSDRPAWKGDEVGYAAAHDRVRTRYGLPSTHMCSACGTAPATEWAYLHGCPRERTAIITVQNGTKREVQYSPDPEMYASLCHPCHVSMDREAAKKKLVEKVQPFATEVA